MNAIDPEDLKNPLKYEIIQEDTDWILYRHKIEKYFVLFDSFLNHFIILTRDDYQLVLKFIKKAYDIEDKEIMDELVPCKN